VISHRAAVMATSEQRWWSTSWIDCVTPRHAVSRLWLMPQVMYRSASFVEWSHVLRCVASCETTRTGTGQRPARWELMPRSQSAVWI